MADEWDTKSAPFDDPLHRPLVGRERLLRTLTSAIGRSTRKSFQLVELVGEPGVGKTRLLSEVATSAREQGLLTLWGRAAEFEQDAPLAAVVDALDDHLELRGRHLVKRLNAPEARLLASVFPALAVDIAHDPIPTGTGGATYRLYRAVRVLLEVLAESSGLMLLLDDVHWADDTTVELLDYLVRHPPRGQVVVAVAYRPAQASARLSAALAQVAPGHGTRMKVAPLSQEEAEQFLGPGFSQARRRWLYESSGGNPFYLEALSRAGDGDASVLPSLSGELADDALQDVPDAVRAALVVELGRLSPTAQLVAHAAAVVGDEFEPISAAAAAEMAGSNALMALDELVSRDVVRLATTPGRFRFRHPLVRHAAYTSSSAGWRVATHGRVAKHLKSLGAPAPLLARHVARSAGFGDLDAVAVLSEAARTVAPRAPATTAHWLKVALRLLPDSPANTPTRLEMLTDLAIALHLSGQLVEGRDTAREALRRLPLDDYARRATVVRTCSILERALGRTVEAKALLLSELQRMPDEYAAEAEPLRMRLAVEHMWGGDLRTAHATLTEVNALRGQDSSVALAVAALRPMVAYAGGDVTAALVHVDEANRLLEAATSEQIAPWLDSLTWLGWAKIMVGRFRDALPQFDRVLDIARSTGQNYIITDLVCGQAQTLGRLGRLPEALTRAEEAVDLARLLGTNQQLTQALAVQSLHASWSGDYPTARRLADQATAAGGASREWWGILARCAKALWMVYSGDLARGQRAVTTICDEFEAFALDRTTLLVSCEAMAQAEAQRGRPEAAAAWADRAERAAHPALEVSRALAQLVRAHALSGPEPVAAAELALRAAQVFGAAELRLDEGRARLRAGQAYATAGDRSSALTALSAAAELFRTCGATALHAQATHAQRRLGLRVATSSRSRQAGPFGLSPRELEIARFVVDGHTNQQIAEKLFIGVRTVETHLSHVFTKLSVTSRVGVSRLLGPILDGLDQN